VKNKTKVWQNNQNQ